jgi:FkbM family methyltransferase
MNKKQFSLTSIIHSSFINNLIKAKMINLIRKRLLEKYFPHRYLIIPEDEKFAHKPLKYYETPIGNYFLPSDAVNDGIATVMKSGKIFESEIIETAKHYIKKGTAVLDIGANYGQMSLLFSQYVGENGQVFSFEADDYIFYILNKNIQANKCNNIKSFLSAVYDRSCDFVFYPEQDFKRFSSYGSYGIDLNASNGRQIETLAIDDLNINMPISFMKVDIQGSDLFALRGAVKTITEHQMPIIFEYEEQFQDEFKTCFQDYIDFINSISYRVEKTINQINYLIVPDKRKNKIN